MLSLPPVTASDCPFDICWSLCYPFLQLQLLIAPLVSFGHCVICPSIYSFWLPLWYLLVIVLSVPPVTASDCPFDIFWSLCYPSLQLRLLIAPLISFCHCVICPSIYSCHCVIVPAVTASDCPFGIFWSLCYLSLHLQLLIAPLISFGHCVIVPPFTASDCPFCICLSLCYLCLHLQLLIAPWLSFGHCFICPSIYSFWLPLWNCLVIVLSVPPVTVSDCPFDIFWLLCYTSLHLQLLIAPLVSFHHCVICPSIYSFWLPLWYLLVIVLSVPPFTASDCAFDIFWSLCYPSLQLQLLIAHLISFGHCVICTSIYSFWLPFDIFWSLCYLYLQLQLLIAPFDIFWSLCYLSSSYGFWLPLWYLWVIVLSFGHCVISFGHCVIRPSSYGFWLPFWYLFPPVTASDCPFGYLIAPVVLVIVLCPVSFGHCVICPSSYSFWLPLWYLLVIVLSVPPFTASDCPFGILWSLCYPSLQLLLLIAPLVSFDHCVISPSIYSFWLPLWNCLVIVLSVPPVTASDCPFGIFWSLCYRTSIYSFWLPLWYLLVIVLSVPPFTASDCPFDIFWSLCYLSLQLQLLIAPLISFGHCVIRPSIYSFWLPLWYLLVIVLSVPPFTASDCPFDIFWSMCYLYLHLQLLIAPLISFGHCVICHSIYSFWLPLWYLLVIVLSVPPFTASDCPFGIFWSLCYLSLQLQLLIAPLISFGHCVIRPSIYSFWLPLWYLLVIVLSVPPVTASDCPFDIFWSMCYLYLHLQLLIAPLISFDHCVICTSSYSFWLPLCYLLVIVLSVPPFTASDSPFGILWSLCYRPSSYSFWLPLCYLLVIVLSVPPFTASDCPFGIFWSLCYRPSSYSFWLPLWYLLVIVLSVPPFTASDCPFDIFWSMCYPSLHLQLLIAPLVSFGHCVICASIYSFWLPLCYHLVIVLSVPPFTASDCPFEIVWSLCYLSIQLQLLIAPLISFGHCVIGPSSYGFWLPLWYLLVIVLSVPPFTASDWYLLVPFDCPFDIFWSLCYPSLPLTSFGHCVICLQLLIAPLVSFGHCVICTCIYSFWLPIWYLLVIVLSVPPVTASDYPFAIFWSLCYLYLHLQLLIAPLLSFGHCVIRPSIYSFWLPLWYLLVIVLSVPPVTASDCPFEIVWSLCFLSLQLQLLIAPLISFGHCVIRPSIYSFWLPLWYLLVIVLFVPPFTTSDCPFDIFWSLCYTSLHLQLLIAPLISFGHCVIRPCSYSFWLPLWYLLVIVLSVPPVTASDCPFGIFWSLCYLSLQLQLLIAPLISFGHCVIGPSRYGFWLPFWYLLVIVLSVPPFTASDCPFDIFWSMCYLYLHLQLLIAHLISFGHCVICHSIYSFWLPLWYLLVIVLSVPPFTASDCPFGIFWSLCYLSLQLQLLIAPLISFGHCVIRPSIYSFWLPLWYLLVIVLSVPPFTASDCPFDIFWSMCYLYLHLQLLIAPLISFDHCVICTSSYSFWLPLCYLLVIVLSVPPFTASDSPFGILWSLFYRPSSYSFWLPLCYLLVIVLSVPPFIASDCPFGIFWSLFYRPSSYSFWLPLWYLLVIVLSVPPFTASDCPFDIFWSMCYPSLHLQLLIAPLVSFGHCVICASIYSFWLPLCYHLVIVLSVPPFTASDCPFEIVWSLCYLSIQLQLLIAPLISFGHCVIGPSSYGFWLPLWYLLVIVLSVPPFTASDCPLGIFWSLCYLSLHLQLLIAPLISFGHCVIRPSSYSFWLPLWYLLVIVLSVPPVTASDCPFDILWSLCYPSLHLQLLIAPLISFGHCVICTSIYSFWLPLWYLLVIVLSVPAFTASDCPFGIFWSLCYLSLQLQLLIAPLLSFGHCVICTSIYSFWLPLCYPLVIVLSVPPFTASDCPFDIFW